MARGLPWSRSAERSRLEDMTKKGRSIVVFDLGGVLVDWNPRYVYRELFEGDEEKVEWFLSNICTAAWNEQQDAGRSFADAVCVLAGEYPEHELLIRAYYDRWEDMIGGAIEQTVQLLAELKQRGVSLFALTNWSAESFPIARRRFPFFDWFDGIVVSGDVRMIKPDPQIYHHLVTTHKVQPQEAVFIDDNLRNVETARQLGFHGVHFVSPAQLRAELEALGFLS
jgi:2-haloacid dehalogenase